MRRMANVMCMRTMCGELRAWYAEKGMGDKDVYVKLR